MLFNNQTEPWPLGFPRVLLGPRAKGLTVLRTIYPVQADLNGPAPTHDRDGVAVRDPHYFACERAGLRISSLRKYGDR